MSDCSNSVTKYVIVEAAQTGGGSFSGLTVCGGGGLTVDFITGCTSDGVNIGGGVFNNGVLTIPTINTTTLSGGTLYGDGSNLTGISTIDSYMTGGTYSNGFITFSGSGVFSDVTVDVSALLDDTNSYVTGSTLNGDTLELSRNGGLSTLTTDLSSINTDNFVSGGTYLNGNLFFSGTSTNQTFSVDVSALLDDTNFYVTGQTLNGTVLETSRNGGLSTLSTDLTSLQFTGNTSGSCISNFHVSNIYGCSPITIHDDIVFVDSKGLISPNGKSELFVRDTEITLQSGTFGVDKVGLVSATQTAGVAMSYLNTTLTKIGQIAIYDNDLTNQTTGTLPQYPTALSTQNGVIRTGVTNSNTLGGLGTIVKTDNTSYVNQVGFNTGEAFETVLGYTTATQDNTITLQNGSGTLAFLSDVQASDTLTEILANGNTTANGQTIQAENGSAVLDLRANGTDGSITLKGGQSTYLQGGTFGATGTSYQTLTPDAMSFGYFNQLFTKVGFMATVNNDGVVVSSSAQPHYPTVFATQNVNVPIGVINTAVGGGINVIGKTDNTFYSNQFGFNSGASFETILVHTTATQDNVATLQDGTGTLAFLGDLTGFTSTDYYVTGATMNGNTLELGRNGLTDVTVDLSQFIDTDTSVTGLTFNTTTYDLTLSQDNGKSNIVSNLAALASDVFVLSGVYDISTGIVTYTTNSGTTFEVSGFTSGMTDSYTSDAYLNGNEIRFDNNIQGTNLYNVDLTPLLSGKTNNSDFYAYTGSTETKLNSKVDNSIFTSYTANTQNILSTKVDGGINNGGGHELFSGITGTDMNFRTLSGGSNTTLSTIGDVIKIDVAIPASDNSFVTGGTVSGTDLVLGRNGGLGDVTIDTSAYFDNTDNYVTGATMNVNILELSRSGGLPNVTVDLSQFVDDTNFYVTGSTMNGNTLELSRNGGLPTLTTDLSQFIDTDNYVTGATYSNGTITLSRQNGTVGVDVPDAYITGATLNGTDLELSRNEGLSTLTADLSSLVSSDNFYVTGGTVSGTDLVLGRNGGLSNVTIDTSAYFDNTDNYVTGATMNVNTLELSRSGGLSNVTVDLSQFVDDTNDGVVSGATMNGNTLELGRTQGLSDVTVDLSQFIDDTNYYVTGSTLNGNTLELGRNGGLSTLSTDLSSLSPDTNLDRKLFIPAAMASTMGSSSLTYHGTTGVALLAFGGNNPDDEMGSFPMVVPQDYVSGGTFELIYTSQTTANDMVWSFGITNASNGVDFSTFTESGPHLDLVVSGQTFLNRGTSQVTTPTGTTFNTYDAVTVRVNRDASDSRDTANNVTGYIYGLIFNYKANN
jgi:hypothetical protein